MARTQSEAKHFFVEKVVAQARAEQVALSNAERQMLSWSESDPDFVVDPNLPKQLASEMPDEDYEQKIAGLLARSFAADVRANREAKRQWRQAVSRYSSKTFSSVFTGTRFGLGRW
jgi:hypothetical protein